MFVAGNFAAVAFVVSQGALSSFQKWTVSVGYSVYAIGIATLLTQKLWLLEALARETNLPGALRDATNPFWVSIVFYVVVALCVIALIWSKSSHEKLPVAPKS